MLENGAIIGISIAAVCVIALVVYGFARWRYYRLLAYEFQLVNSSSTGLLRQAFEAEEQHLSCDDDDDNNDDDRVIFFQHNCSSSSDGEGDVDGDDCEVAKPEATHTGSRFPEKDESLHSEQEF